MLFHKAKKMLCRGMLIGAVVVSASSCFADTRFWTPRTDAQAAQEFPYFGVTLESEELREYLRGSPAEGAAEGLSLRLPLPDRSFTLLQAFDSPVMSPELAEKYPRIRTYKVRGVENPSLSGRIDFTDTGFRAFLTMAGQSVLIEPESTFSSGDAGEHYRVFYKQDLPHIPKPVESERIPRPESSAAPVERPADEETGVLARWWRTIKSWF